MPLIDAFDEFGPYRPSPQAVRERAAEDTPASGPAGFASNYGHLLDAACLADSLVTSGVTMSPGLSVAQILKHFRAPASLFTAGAHAGSFSAGRASLRSFNLAFVDEIDSESKPDDVLKRAAAYVQSRPPEDLLRPFTGVRGSLPPRSAYDPEELLAQSGPAMTIRYRSQYRHADAHAMGESVPLGRDGRPRDPRLSEVFPAARWRIIPPCFATMGYGQTHLTEFVAEADITAVQACERLMGVWALACFDTHAGEFTRPVRIVDAGPRNIVLQIARRGMRHSLNLV